MDGTNHTATGEACSPTAAGVGSRERAIDAPGASAPGVVSAWVIEAAGPSYWTGHGRDANAFSHSHEDAVRFAREIDASLVLSWIIVPELRRVLAVREHAWLSVHVPTGGV